MSACRLVPAPRLTCATEKHRAAALRDTLTSLDTRNSFLARATDTRAPSQRSSERLTANAAAFGSRPASRKSRVHTTDYSYDDLAYRQPVGPMM